ncbi:MAG: hypothetical protein CMJ18_12130 [Phycisphaeraceae bacterium]|nr:hypothetical protein [Phycisphaeraceae bacterium]
MPVFLDDQQVSLEGDDLSQILASAGRTLEDSGRIVVEVHLDGQVLQDAQLDEQSHQTLGTSEVRLYTARPTEIALEALQGMLPQIDSALGLQSGAADRLRRDEHGEAMGELSQAVDIWQQVQQAVVRSVLLVGIDVEDVSVDSGSARDIIEEMVDELRAVRDVIGDGDFVSLADILEHEWPGYAERWRHLLECLIRRIDEMD